MAKPKAERSLLRALEAPRGVRALNLRGAPLRELPHGLSTLVDLEPLDLSQTSLTRLGREIGSLSKLVTLSLSEAYSLKVLGPESVASGLGTVRGRSFRITVLVARCFEL